MRPPEFTAYAFVDGRCFETVWRERIQFIAGQEVPFDLQKLLDMCRAQKGFYYDAEPSKKDAETEEEFDARRTAKRESLDRIQNEAGFHVRCGLTRGRGGRRHPQRQKAVDVQLAVDVLMHAVRKNFSTVALFAEDLDFLPLVEALVDLGVYVQLFATRSCVKELRSAADEWICLSAWNLLDLVSDLNASLVPDRAAGSPKDVMAAQRRGKSESGQEIVHVQFEKVDRIYFPPRRLISHSDLATLERYLKSEFGGIEWHPA